ncbi:hypothetical protein HPP92_022606 [Vanilla planifolia]|uniref:NAC domain-containing protein n=1 Tax=Vanilla planifolia TaxID=51239 RepID=A0A835PPD5_VANPL|nr:hypothetical protein HPP92_022887 [Vanilla planifolia]KAG0459478.1 hypothetical protein HPP92_022606 [Vanilla planifolia]
MEYLCPSLPPGFRFHPTDEELILHYLCKKAESAPCPVRVIADVDIYKFNPWDLPAKALFGEREWYFFSPRDRKYPNGARPNRTAASGYWKATGTEKPILMSRANKIIGFKKALVFCRGRPPKCVKTSWMMHEYRVAETRHKQPTKFSMRLDELVLCRIYRKTSRHHSVPAAEDEGTQNLANTKVMNKSFSVSDLLVEEAEFSPLLETPVTLSLSSDVAQPSPNISQCFNTENSYRNGSYFLEEGQITHRPMLLNNVQMHFHIANQLDVSQPFLSQQLLTDPLLEMP